MGDDQKPRCSSRIVIETYNFKFLPFLIHGYHTPKLKNVAFSAVAFTPRYFMPMSHGVNNKASASVFPLSLPLTRFSPGLFVVLHKILYQSRFCSDQIIVKNNTFSK